MNILAVGCHPDDLEIGCGGTLARYAAEGHRVVCCHVASGNMGHAVIMPDELRVIRQTEAREAGKVLGVSEVVSLDVNDLEVRSDDPELLLKTVELIRRARPDVVITHSPEDYMADHVEVSKLVFDASFSASVPHFGSGAACAVTPIYYMDTLAGVNFLPAEYVDISDYIETKLAALACHESQIKWMLEHDKIDFIDFVRICVQFRGLQCGAAYAEGFRPCVTWPRMTARRLLP